MDNAAALDWKEEIPSHTRREYFVEKVEKNDNRSYLAAKQCIDTVAALTAGMLLLLPMLLIGILICLDSDGPALFKQERLGKDGKTFMIYKFRTMYLNAEENGPQWAEKIDGRCTRMGRVLRNTRLDELPQLWNIIKGEMSFVGPRPERAYFYDLFETYIHGFRNRLCIKPGLTGWAQVNGGYDLLPEEKIVYDLQYIANMSIKMDLICVLKTAALLFSQEGAR